MKDVNFLIPTFVSLIFALALIAFYFYKSNNNTLMGILARLTWQRYKPAEIRKDTRSRDAIMLVILFIMIFAFGLKLISFAVIISDSMKPQFQRGDLILTQSIIKEPNVGDIITFKANNVQNPVTHRVINVRDNIVTTKGDNNPLVDSYATKKEDILAKAIVIGNNTAVIKGVGSYFILDFSKEGKLYKFGDQYTFIQQMFITIRTWGYVITLIAVTMLIMSMTGKRR